MNTHSKAKLTARSRAEMIRRILDLHQPVAAVAAGLLSFSPTYCLNFLRHAHYATD